MNFKITILLFTSLFVIESIMAQTSEQSAAQEKERLDNLGKQTSTEKTTDGWNRKGGIGLDLGQLININPYVGSGSNRLGFGGAIQFKANYNKGPLSWNNDFLVNLTVQRIGSGTISFGSKETQAFEKALDLLNLNTNMAYKISETSFWAYALDLGLRSQLLNSYVDSATNKIYLKELKEGSYNTSLVSKLFSPALISLGPGIKFKKYNSWEAFYSPVAGQILLIADKDIANLGIHGTELKDGSLTEFKQNKFSLGSMLKLAYSQQLFTRLNLNSELSLFSDYLDKPQNIDVIWTNGLGLEVFKGFNLLLKVDAYYDDNKVNSITDGNAVGGVSGTGKRVNLIQQLLLSYSRSF